MDKKIDIAKIRALAKSGGDGASLEEVFARCCRAAEKNPGITPFDEQLLAAAALAEGRMVQMQTGEGKTLAAVLAACYAAIRGERVHVLTFNDYLARRDREWMGPIYDELGVSVGCITEKTPRADRAELYKKQVLYITAKEAGFDYLRDFVCFDTAEMVFPEKLDFAIVDEADSILIDEARIPLVIAGDMDVKQDGSIAAIYEKVKDFTEDDYGIDEESRNIYLTDDGADKAESIFGCDIYDAENVALLGGVCACIKARSVLKEDKDYIVRDGAVVLIDEFTGRAAEGRVFPGELQAAVEAKHGLKITSRGRIMGNIALQYYARLYPRIAGMTGTALAARDEFDRMYGMDTVVIPTRLPCIREDKPPELYYDKTEKHKAIVAAVCEAAEKQRPVLVGTESIEESDTIAALIREKGLECAVLNAKNDEEEADVIARAGERGTITISTNMAGRGVDIKLGGKDSADKEFVASVGGLLVIASSMRESSRMTSQLRGRAGRQGDPGESRVFVALDDEVITRYDLKSLVSARHYPSERVSGAISDKTLLKEVERIQRISEGAAFDERMSLMRYTTIGEKHRGLTFGRRRALLDGEYNSKMWRENAPELYEKAAAKFGEERLQTLENTVLAALLNEFHCDYLDYTAYLSEGIHLMQVAGKSPAEEYNIACEEYYVAAAETLPDRMAEKLEELLSCGSIDEYKVDKPSRTYTYLLNDRGEEFKKKPVLVGFFSEDPELLGAKKSPENGEDSEEAESTIFSDPEETPPKKGFFGRLFGKK